MIRIWIMRQRKGHDGLRTLCMVRDPDSASPTLRHLFCQGQAKAGSFGLRGE